jgi:hypothetical protein
MPDGFRRSRNCSLSRIAPALRRDAHQLDHERGGNSFGLP